MFEKLCLHAGFFSLGFQSLMTGSLKSLWQGRHWPTYRMRSNSSPLNGLSPGRDVFTSGLPAISTKLSVACLNGGPANFMAGVNSHWPLFRLMLPVPSPKLRESRWQSSQLLPFFCVVCGSIFETVKRTNSRSCFPLSSRKETMSCQPGTRTTTSRLPSCFSNIPNGGFS